MRKCHLWCLLALAATLTACGGGGGGDQQDPAYRLSFTPGTLTASYAQGTSTPLSVTATLDRSVSQTVNVAIVDSVGVIEPNVQLSPGSGNSYQAVLMTKASLAMGEHSGNLQIKICFDSPIACASPLPGSPFSLPYKFTVTAPSAASVNPAHVSVDASQDEVPTLQLAVNLPSSTGTAFAEFIDRAGVFQFSSGPVTISGQGLNRVLMLNPTLAPGSYSGQIELHICKLQPCTQELPGSPVIVPYSITLKPSVNLSALGRSPGVGEWAQYQANAAHTGYVPMTLDASKFNRRWRWSVPVSETTGQSGVATAFQPVVTSNNLVYVLTSGYFQSATLYALAEHDHTLQWKKEFGGIFAANPPSTDAGAVYLATSGHQDTAMWGFNGSTGEQKFRTPFNSQWEHYLAPTIVDGNVYTNGGYHGGLLSFKTSDGTQNWFGNLAQYDMWTPAVDGSYAYAFMPNGLVGLNVADGSQAFVINDPNNAIQPYSVHGAPMQVGPGSLVVINGPGSSGSKNRLVNFDAMGRNIKWSVEGSFSGAPAYANGMIYTINGAQFEARSVIDGSRLWAWLPDEASTEPFRNDYGQTARNIIVTDNLVFVSTVTKVYAISLATHQTLWTFNKPGGLALSPNGILYVSTNAVGDLPAGLIAINLR